MIALELSVTHHSGPKKAMRCVHCLSILEKKTKDHVFPSSWYPATTPAKIQRWTVPSCGECNGKYGEMEKELFIRAAMCNQRLIEDPAHLRIYFAEENSIQDVLRVFDKFGAATHLGPGFRVTRAVAHDDHRLVMYKIDIWGTWSIYAVIGPPDNERETHSS